MLDVITATYDNIQNNLFTGLIFVDLKKAFDTVCHKTLLSKLFSYGIRGVALDLLTSYLNSRQQFVSLNQNQSDMIEVKLGIPQGSTLGPLFFLIYINDLPNAVNCVPRLFADDTCLVIQATNLDTLQTKINNELKTLYNWCCINK